MPVVVNGKRYDGKVRFEPFEAVVYETVRTYCGKPFKAKEHHERLLKSAETVGITKLPDFEFFLENLEIASEGVEGEVYFRVYLKSDGTLIVESSKVPSENVIADLEFSPFRKLSGIPSHLKIVGRTDVFLARLHKKTYDVLMLNEEGLLAEGSFSNVFLVIEEKLVTPSLETGILSGITREVVIEIAKRSKIDVEERFVLPWEIFKADEIFLTHTSRGIVPVGKVEWKEFEAPGKVTSKLIEKFKGFVMKNC